MKINIPFDEFRLYIALNEICFPKNLSAYSILALSYNNTSKGLNGWMIYNIEKEFQRQGLDFESEKSKFILSNINEEYSICPSYPSKLIIPRYIKKHQIKECSLFRTKGRFPTMCYFYKKTQTGIWRSSQTRTGLTQQRCESDEIMLHRMGEYNEKLIIYDARPYFNALANRVN
jgi:hypothetical protein